MGILIRDERPTLARIYIDLGLNEFARVKKKSISLYLFANGQLESYRMKPENYIVKESPKASIIETA